MFFNYRRCLNVPIMQSVRSEVILHPFNVNSRQYGCPIIGKVYKEKETCLQLLVQSRCAIRRRCFCLVWLWSIRLINWITCNERSNKVLCSWNTLDKHILWYEIETEREEGKTRCREDRIIRMSQVLITPETSNERLRNQLTSCMQTRDRRLYVISALSSRMFSSRCGNIAKQRSTGVAKHDINQLKV